MRAILPKSAPDRRPPVSDGINIPTTLTCILTEICLFSIASNKVMNSIDDVPGYWPYEKADPSCEKVGARFRNLRDRLVKTSIYCDYPHTRARMNSR
jgi:hypothetical protein